MPELTKIPVEKKYQSIPAYVSTHREIRKIAAEEERRIMDVVSEMVALYKGIKRKGGKSAAGKALPPAAFIAAQPVQTVRK